MNGTERSDVDWLDVVDPDSGDAVGRVQCTSRESIDAAIERAANMVAAAPPARHRRSEALSKCADFIVANVNDFISTLVSEGIKTISEATVEVKRAEATLRDYARLALDSSSSLSAVADGSPKGDRVTAHVEDTPVGVVAAFTPFNDPLNLVAHKLGAAIAAGCPVIVKPHELTPMSGDLLIRNTDWSSLEAGFVQVVHGLGRTAGDQLVRDRRVAAISFTGGVDTAQQISATAGLKLLLFELGGNCPTLIWNDAELEAAVPALISGMTAAAGQNCLHVQRIYAHADIHDELLVRLVDGLNAVRLGSKVDAATQMGPLITPEVAQRIHTAVGAAATAGAQIAAGGDRHGRAGHQPTLLVDVDAQSPLNLDEVFGPVTTLTPIDSLSKALTLMNRTPTPLQAGVYTNTLDVAATCSTQLRFGAVLINRTSDFRIDTLPFGGPRHAGIGREGGRYGIQHLTQPQLTLTSVR